MRVLILGGTGFIGAAVARAMSRKGHQVAVLHRGLDCEVDNGLHVHGERHQPEGWADRCTDFAPQIVVDTIAATAADARLTLTTFAPVAHRIVLLSSMDVYRACALFHGTEAGDYHPGPMAETAPLRRDPGLYPASTLARLRRLHGWMGRGYDKLGMERAAAAWPNSALVTVLRLGPVFGPGDRQRHLFPYWRRMADRRPAVLLPRGWAQWRSSRGYVGNVAEGVVLAALAPRAAGRVYNLAGEAGYSEAEWTQLVASAWGWPGRIVVTAPESTPAHLHVAARVGQPLVLDTQRIRQELGYRETVTMHEALAASLGWERTHPPAGDDLIPQPGYEAEDRALYALGWRPLRKPPAPPSPVPAPVEAAWRGHEQSGATSGSAARAPAIDARPQASACSQCEQRGSDPAKSGEPLHSPEAA